MDALIIVIVVVIILVGALLGLYYMAKRNPDTALYLKRRTWLVFCIIGGVVLAVILAPSLGSDSANGIGFFTALIAYVIGVATIKGE